MSTGRDDCPKAQLMASKGSALARQFRRKVVWECADVFASKADTHARSSPGLVLRGMARLSYKVRAPRPLILSPVDVTG
jgi:hypothetical protein